MLVDVKILIFLFSGPGNDQKRGQMGGKLGYAANKAKVPAGFFCFCPNSYITGICIPTT